MTQISQFVGLTIPTWTLPLIFKYCFSGYGQFTVFRTKAEAKAYLKNNSIIHRIKDLLVITDELRQKISDTHPSQIFEVIDNVAVPMEIEMIDRRSDKQISDDLWNDSNPENCDACADQESIAAPGETTKCRAHQVKSDTEHYAEMRKFFNENLKDLEFEPMLPYCSQCGKKDPAYVGLMRCFERPSPLVFAFCIECRDDLVRCADAARQSPERFGV